ncbi:MAG: hypothetical protein ACO3JL_03195 [Myxococcota bacterium]
MEAEDPAVASEQAARTLRRFTDEVRLQAHLGRLEGRDAVSAVEPHLRHLERRLLDLGRQWQRAGEEAALQAHLATMDAKDRWTLLEVALRELTGDVRQTLQHTKDAVRARFDEGRLQLHLGKLEAQERLGPRDVSGVSASARALQADAAHFFSRLEHALDDLLERLTPGKRRREEETDARKGAGD